MKKFSINKNKMVKERAKGGEHTHFIENETIKDESISRAKDNQFFFL